MKLISVAVLLVSSCAAAAQSQYATMVSTNIADLAGNKLQNGTITFTPVLTPGSATPVAPHLASGGRALPKPVTFKVINGVIAGIYSTAQLVDVTQANPTNFCYADTIHDNVSGDSWSPDSCVQPAYNASWCSVTGGVTTCNFDNYVPTGVPGALQVVGPTGPTGPSGTSGANGTNCASGASPGTCSFNGTLIATQLVGPASTIPLNTRIWVEGASVTGAYDAQGDVYISAQNGGSGYSGTGIATVSGLTCALTQPTVGVAVDPSGKLSFALTGIGAKCPGGTASVTVSGFATGSGATATLTSYAATYPGTYANAWPLIATTLPAFSGRVASYHNWAVSGTTVADALTRFTTNGYAAMCASTSYNEYFLVAGDLAQNSIVLGASVSDTYSQWLALTHALKSAGCKVIVTTPIAPRGAPIDPVQFANVMSVAQMIRWGIQGVDYDYGFDMGAEIGTPTDNGLFAWDNIHLTANGHVVAAGMFNATMMQGGAFNLAAQPLGYFLSPVWTNSTVNAGTGLIVRGSQTGTPAGSFGAGYNAGVGYLTVNSGTTTPGCFNLVGQVLSGTQTSLLNLCSGIVTFGNTGATNFSGFLTIAGAGSGTSANTFGAGYSGGVGYLTVNSGGATPGSFQFVGQGTGGQTFYIAIDNTGLKNANSLLLPAGLTGRHGTSGTKVQLSDGTGATGNCPKFASDGSLTDSGVGCGGGGGGGSVLATVAPTTYSGTAGVSNTTLYTTPSGASHIYQMCAPVYVTTAGTAGTVAMFVQFVLGGHTYANYMGTTSTSLTTVWNANQSGTNGYPVCSVFQADPSTNIQYSVFMTGATGTPTVAYSETLTLLQ